MSLIDLSDLDPRALHLMWLLKQKGFETRVCGGAVRDIMTGETPKDWDMATTALPEQVMDVMKTEGIQVIPTGLQHGTVTAVFEGENFEITTLRIDQNTDGRHAEVEFTDDWKLDAERRDFTINAMSIDSDGILHDYFGGVEHAARKQIVFVGDPEQRIQEDYLRILRYFRFRARMLEQKDSSTGWSWTDVDKPAHDSIINNAQGLRGISGERIWAELKKIFAFRKALHPTIKAMQAVEVLPLIGLEPVKRGYNLAVVRRSDDRPSVLLASMFAREQVELAHDLLKDVYHASREEIWPVEFYIKNRDFPVTRINAFRLLAKHDKSYVLAWIAIHSELGSIRASGAQRRRRDILLYDEISDLEIPKFPVSGQDLIDLGMKPGPKMGQVLNELREVWADLEFEASRDYLINLVSRTGGHIK